MKKSAIWAPGALFVADCTKTKRTATDSDLMESNLWTEVNGRKTDLCVLWNQSNMEVCVTNFDGRTVSVMVSDKNGMIHDMVLGFDSIQNYISEPSDFGTSIGHYASRINQGKFALDGVEYQLPRNNYGHCLYGNPRGHQYQIYDALQTGPQELKLTYRSKGGEEGFPGNIIYKVIMKLTGDNTIDIQHEAETDRPTIVNVTDHSYLNLDGDVGSNADHLLAIDIDSYIPVDDTFMTTGEIMTVEDTPMDFHMPTSVGTCINDFDFIQLKNDSSYDHNWMLNAKRDITRKATILESPETGIVLDVYTNELGIRVYVGSFLDGSLIGGKGIIHNQRASTRLGTQKYPDISNKPEWPSVMLRLGEKYNGHCILRFSVDNSKRSQASLVVLV